MKLLRYGIGDLSALAGDTHKFESRYLDGLVGPYPEKKAWGLSSLGLGFIGVQYLVFFFLGGGGTHCAI